MGDGEEEGEVAGAEDLGAEECDGSALFYWSGDSPTKGEAAEDGEEADQGDADRPERAGAPTSADGGNAEEQAAKGGKGQERSAPQDAHERLEEKR